LKGEILKMDWQDIITNRNILVRPAGFEPTADLIKNFPKFVSPHNSVKDLKKINGDRVGTEAKK
jgi:hypothetical protein